MIQTRRRRVLHRKRDVSIPHRYDPNHWQPICSCWTAKFQFLIGTIQTRYTFRRSKSEIRVSIPHRYDPNPFASWTVPGTKSGRFNSSYVRSKPESWTVPGMRSGRFNSSYVRSKRGWSEMQRLKALFVSIPHRYDPNQDPAFFHLTFDEFVSIPHRYDPNPSTGFATAKAASSFNSS